MATIDFVPYAAQAGALVEDQAAYVADPQTALGQQDGIADPANANKAWRQGAFFAAAWATVVSNALTIDVLDDGDLANLVTEIQEMLRALAPPVTANLTALTSVGAGNFTVPDQTYYLFIEGWGGGGGTERATTGNAVSGAGSGAYFRQVQAVTPGQVIPYVIGAGGVATGSGTPGGNGGTTTWNGTITATGGTGGSVSGAGSGGSATGAQVNYAGRTGININSTVQGGDGGPAPLGGSGGNTGSSPGGSQAGAQPGGGAGGPSESGGSTPGAAGGKGQINVWY